MTLTELINSEPLNANRTDAEVHAWLLESVPAFTDVSWLDLSMWVVQFNLRPALLTSASTGTDAAKTAAQHILDCIAAGQPLSGSDARVRAVISTAVPAGAARTALVAMATVQVQRWQAAGILRPKMGHVMEARA